ncbi:hypothetical protein [Pedobacter sp. MR2016-24]|uniref:hypothetical protein n=1 Tax=Pedobacter sp. MR2016-24 TaxID=2994466 RepID=UPI0022486F82|nr:hypothetical protein [Pedobacter sp. MR2016-24]MCX2482966.1 hypothetical protein [Pedobacter sp. MR2016-24]MDO7743041.1 hypothetical protein [Pedobacter sp.]
MITPEEQHQEEENKKTVYKETTEEEELNSGETSSPGQSGRSEFTRHPDRKNPPLGSSHEPGVTPGRDF